MHQLPLPEFAREPSARREGLNLQRRQQPLLLLLLRMVMMQALRWDRSRGRPVAREGQKVGIMAAGGAVRH